jgi:hypothetical protein
VATDRVRVIVFRPGTAPETTTIASTLDAMREVVGGSLGGLKIAPSIYLHFNDDGRVLGKPTCAFVDDLGDVVVGTCFAVGVDDQGEIRSLDDAEIATVSRIVTPVAYAAPGRFQA